MSASILGRFSWYELMTTDPDAAGAFYAEVVGWGTREWRAGSEPYSVWMRDGDTLVAGHMALPPEVVEGGARPHWIAYVATPHLDATLSSATAKGASVVWGPIEVDDVGRLAGIDDPFGAVIALHEPVGPIPGDATAEVPVGGVSWHELATTDPTAALDFYRELFGWRAGSSTDMGEMGTYQEFDAGRHPLGGIYRKTPEIPAASWLLYFRVADLDAAAARVEAEGGAVHNGPMDVPGGDRVAQCADPQGAWFALHART